MTAECLITVVANNEGPVIIAILLIYPLVIILSPIINILSVS